MKHYTFCHPTRSLRNSWRCPLAEFIAFVNQGKGICTKGLAKKPWANMEYNLRRIHRGARLGTMAAVAMQNILRRIFC
jgi:hypothetical protein